MRSSEFDFREHARRCYDALVLLVPDAHLGGIFTDGKQYYLVCDKAETPRDDGRTLADWFHGIEVPAGFPIRVTKEVPPHATEIPPRALEEVAIGKGAGATLQALFSLLSLALPHDFPLVGLAEGIGMLRVIVSRLLSADEVDLLARAMSDVGVVLKHEVEVNPGASPRPVGGDALLLQPARVSVSDAPATLAALVEEDEDYWRTVRVRLLTSTTDEMVEVRPWSDLSGIACLVGTPFAASNIRRYFSFYSRLVLVAPTAKTMEVSLKALRVTQRELTDLVGSGHVRVLFPQPLQRYDLAWVAELAEANAGGLLFSRRLAAAAVADARRRHPVLSTPATALERRDFIQYLARVANAAPPQVRPFFEAMIAGLPESWSRFESLLNLCGAMAGLHGPMVHIASSLCEAAYGRVLGAEFAPVGAALDWAGALGADLCPADVEGFNESAVVRLLLALYSGFAGEGVPLAKPHELMIADNLLYVDNDAAIREFVAEMGASDRDRFRAFVRETGRTAPTREEVQEAVRKWNEFVHKYERNPDRVRVVGLSGAIFAGVKAAVASKGGFAEVVPWLTALAPFLVSKLDGVVRENRFIGALLDQINGTLAGAPPAAVLLSRMKKRVTGMKEQPFRG